MLRNPHGLRRVSECVLQNAIRTMYDNPYIKTFKPKKPPSPTFHKQTTGLTGLFVDEHAHQNLLKEYGRLMKVLEQIPSHSSYRKYTEQLVKKRIALVQKEPDIQKLEERIGMGQIEEVIQQAKYEILAAKEILKSQAWEPLVEKAPEGQNLKSFWMDLPSPYLPGALSLLDQLDKKLLVVLRDGRTLIGYLRTIDQFANLVLHGTLERIHVDKYYGDIQRGVFLIRGENVVLAGEIDETKEHSSGLIPVSAEEILLLQQKKLEEKERFEETRNKIMKGRGRLAKPTVDVYDES